MAAVKGAVRVINWMLHGLVFRVECEGLHYFHSYATVTDIVIAIVTVFVILIVVVILYMCLFRFVSLLSTFQLCWRKLPGTISPVVAFRQPLRFTPFRFVFRFVSFHFGRFVSFPFVWFVSFRFSLDSFV